jgi:hypothetical protein
MEPRSYMASITKSLLKTGWTRTDGQGRYVRWRLPPDVKIVVDMTEEKVYDASKENENDGTDGGGSNNYNNNKDEVAAKKDLATTDNLVKQTGQDDETLDDGKSEPPSKEKRDESVVGDDDEGGVDSGSVDASTNVGTAG